MFDDSIPISFLKFSRNDNIVQLFGFMYYGKLTIILGINKKNIKNYDTFYFLQ